MMILINIVALIFVLGVMIFVHEFGHFATAKYFGIKVEVFAFGFGPRLFGVRRGDTDYRVCALPLGGYVKMKGENPDEELTGDPGEYLTRPKWQRFLVLVMGPAMNVVLALTLFTFVFMGGVRVFTWTEQPVEIGWIVDDSPAAESDLSVGDTIVAVDGEPAGTWNDFSLREAISGGQPMQLTVVGAHGERRTLSVTPRAMPPNDQGWLGILPPPPVTLAEVEEGGPADRAGLRPGDRLLAVEGEPVGASQVTVQQLIAERPHQPTAFLIERDGERMTLTVTPDERPAEEGGGGVVGVKLQVDTTVRDFGFVGAVGQAFKESGRQVRLVGEILGRIFTGRMSVKTLSGPIEIAQYSGAAASTGSPSVLASFMAIVSLQLGLLNLLPIPILDGGHIAVLAFEGLIRRDLSMKVKERMLQIGFILLVTLMAVVITFDVIKSLPLGWQEYLPF